MDKLVLRMRGRRVDDVRVIRSAMRQSLRREAKIMALVPPGLDFAGPYWGGLLVPVANGGKWLSTMLGLCRAFNYEIRTCVHERRVVELWLCRRPIACCRITSH